MAKKQIKDYLKPIHEDGCGIHRNVGMSTLAAHTVNQVMGKPRCDCGLEEATDVAREVLGNE